MAARAACALFVDLRFALVHLIPIYLLRVGAEVGGVQELPRWTSVAHSCAVGGGRPVPPFWVTLEARLACLDLSPPPHPRFARFPAITVG